MRCIAALFALCQLAFVAGPALAQTAAEYSANAAGHMRSLATETWIEEWDPATGQWVRIDSETVSDTGQAAIPTLTQTFVNGRMISETRSAARFAQREGQTAAATTLARYGPFVVTSPTSASLVGSTNSASPAQFDAMLRDFPQIAMLNMIEAPGTSNDIANLAVGRRIHAAGIATHVPNGGSVRSGAVELFLAGSTRTIDSGAQFAVHSWLDNFGREADDFAPNHPAHRLYLDYYLEMGMSEAHAREFYAMTNSVPHSRALWLDAAAMRHWIGPDLPRPAPRAGPDHPARIAVASATLKPIVLTIDAAPIPAIEIDWYAGANSAKAELIGYSDLSGMHLAPIGL